MSVEAIRTPETLTLYEELRTAKRTLAITATRTTARYVLNTAGCVYLHFFHLVRVQLFLDALCEGRCQPTPCRRLTAAIVDGRGERVVNGEVGCEGEALRRSGGRTVGQCRWVGREYVGECWRRGVRVVEKGLLRC